MVLPNEVLLGEVSILLAEGKSVILRTKGNSMLPFIRGSRDSVELLKRANVLENDIVLARLADGRYVLHRVIDIDGESVTLMGDGNIRGTESCDISGVCGTAVSIIKNNGCNIDCQSKGFIRKVRIWRRMLPLRRYLLWIYRKLLKIK